jgi:hypothetical protein
MTLSGKPVPQQCIRVRRCTSTYRAERIYRVSHPPQRKSGMASSRGRRHGQVCASFGHLREPQASPPGECLSSRGGSLTINLGDYAAIIPNKLAAALPNSSRVTLHNKL